MATSPTSVTKGANIELNIFLSDSDAMCANSEELRELEPSSRSRIDACKKAVVTSASRAESEFKTSFRIIKLLRLVNVIREVTRMKIWFLESAISKLPLKFKIPADPPVIEIISGPMRSRRRIFEQESRT